MQFDLHSVVEVAVFVKEPQYTVVGLCMDALLLERCDLVFLAREQVQLEHLQEGVTVLGSELKGEVEIVFRVGKLTVAVFNVVCHRDSGTLTPDLSTLGDLSQGLVKSAEGLIIILLCLSSRMLELDERGP